VILTSDPFKCSASISHTNDWLVLVPIFYDDELVGWASQFGHQCPHATHPTTTVFGAHPTTVSVKVTAAQVAPFDMSVASTAGFAASGQLLVGAETLTYDSKTATSFHITARGDGMPPRLGRAARMRGWWAGLAACGVRGLKPAVGTLRESAGRLRRAGELMGRGVPLQAVRVLGAWPGNLKEGLGRVGDF